MDRAKSASQLARNSVLGRVSDALKKDTRCALKEVSIEWILEDRSNKNREVRVGSIPAFGADNIRFDWAIPGPVCRPDGLENRRGTRLF